MKLDRIGWILTLPLVLSACGGSDDNSGESVAASAAVEIFAPSAGDLEYAEITRGWSDAAFEGCGRVLKETLGTRDLVQGALDSVSDDAGKAAAEVEDATHWLELGNAKLREVHPRLLGGECDGDITLALDEAVQFFVKAGTSAVQAGQIASGV